jgi:hypothetical protein
MSEEKEKYIRPFFINFDKDVWELIEAERERNERDIKKIIQNAIKFYLQHNNGEIDG